MAKFEVGDLVVLKSGSMRMVVEEAEDDAVSTVWCNEGVIGRDRFAVALLNKWEHREDQGGFRGRGGDRRDDRGGDRDDRGPRGGGYKGGRDRDDRGGGGYKGNRDRGDRGDDDRPRGKTGWDGKPREKKYFRKDD